MNNRKQWSQIPYTHSRSGTWQKSALERTQEQIHIDHALKEVKEETPNIQKRNEKNYKNENIKDKQNIPKIHILGIPEGEKKQVATLELKF